VAKTISKKKKKKKEEKKMLGIGIKALTPPQTFHYM
jgi:hypothetical protein